MSSTSMRCPAEVADALDKIGSVPRFGFARDKPGVFLWVVWKWRGVKQARRLASVRYAAL